MQLPLSSASALPIDVEPSLSTLPLTSSTLSSIKLEKPVPQHFKFNPFASQIMRIGGHSDIRSTVIPRQNESETFSIVFDQMFCTLNTSVTSFYDRATANWHALPLLFTAFAKICTCKGTAYSGTVDWLFRPTLLISYLFASLKTMPGPK